MNEISDLADALRDRADELARLLLPRGSRQGRDWKATSANSPIGEAISVIVSGPKKGVVGFWQSDKGGDMLDLIERVLGLSKRQAIDWARRYIGLDSEPLVYLKRARIPGEAIRIAREDQTRRIRGANGIWRAAQPLSGPPADYLRRRGIDPGIADDTIRAHPGLPHPEGGAFPALVAQVSAPNGAFAGIWRIYVKPDGSGKAPVQNPKLGLGSIAGGAVRIGGMAPEIGAAEGIENSLAARQIVYREAGVLLPVWATLSTGGMRRFAPPDGVKSVRIFADADPVKFTAGKIIPSPGIEAARFLEKRLQMAGVNGLCEIPPPPFDWLEVQERAI